MKKLILIISIILFACFNATAAPLPGAEKKAAMFHDMSVDNAKTNAFQVPWNTVYIGVFIPSIDNGTVGIEVYQHGAHVDTLYTDVSAADLLSSSDTNWVPVIDLSDGADAVILASGSDPGFVDITPFVAALRGHWIRFTSAAQSSSDITYWVIFGSAMKE